jgi:hypothetical protein
MCCFVSVKFALPLVVPVCHGGDWRCCFVSVKFALPLVVPVCLGGDWRCCFVSVKRAMLKRVNRRRCSKRRGKG